MQEDGEEIVVQELPAWVAAIAAGLATLAFAAWLAWRRRRADDV